MKKEVIKTIAIALLAGYAILTHFQIMDLKAKQREQLGYIVGVQEAMINTQDATKQVQESQIFVLREVLKIKVALTQY